MRVEGITVREEEGEKETEESDEKTFTEICLRLEDSGDVSIAQLKKHKEKIIPVKNAKNSFFIL